MNSHTRQTRHGLRRGRQDLPGADRFHCAPSVATYSKKQHAKHSISKAARRTPASSSPCPAASISSVTAALLKAEGYDVVGVTLQLYDHGAATHRKGACCAGQDIHDARARRRAHRHSALRARL